MTSDDVLMLEDVFFIFIFDDTKLETPADGGHHLWS
jgi:hypothetical protein